VFVFVALYYYCDVESGKIPGQIMVDPDNPVWLVYNRDKDENGKKDPFFLCGPGDPEGFLYRGRRNPDGSRSGDQIDLIQKLIRYGGNCIYMIAVRTHGGDARQSAENEPDTYPDDKHNPWINQEPQNGINHNILNQWEYWFNEMDKNEIVIYFFFYDDAIKVANKFGWSLNPNGELHSDERTFIQTLVNKFKHHKHLIWCIMEEAQEIGEQWQLHISQIAKTIREVDDFNHIIASHQLGGNVFYHPNDPNIEQFALQTHKDYVATKEDLHQWILEAWDNSNGRYNINMAEDYVHGNISFPEKNREEIRQRNWAAAMAGAYSMVLGMNIENTPDLWLQDCRILQRFFESTTFNQMGPMDSEALPETEYVLANPEFDFILYSSNATSSLSLKNLAKGIYTLNWIDCSTGFKKKHKNIHMGNKKVSFKKPLNFGNEIALFIFREDIRP
jgi:hypothetical protein